MGDLEVDSGQGRYDVWLVVAPAGEVPAVMVVRQAASVVPSQSIGLGDAARIIASIPAVLVVNVDDGTAQRVAQIIEDSGGRCDRRDAVANLLVLDPRTRIAAAGSADPVLLSLVRALAELDVRATAHRRAHEIPPDDLMDALRTGRVGELAGRVHHLGEGDDLIIDLLGRYRVADEPTRHWLRDQIQEMYALRDLVNGRITHECQRLLDGELEASIEDAVTAVCVSNLQPDERDISISLGALWIAATEHGIDPAPVFERLAPLAASEHTKRFLERFDTSAYFTQSVAPRL